MRGESIKASSVAVVSLHPGHRPRQPRLVASLRGEVEHLVGAVEHVEAARISRIGVVDRAVVAAAKSTEAGRLLASERRGAEIVVVLAFDPLGRIERNAEIEIEVAAGRRYPAERPTHALLVGFDLGKRCA